MDLISACPPTVRPKGCKRGRTAGAAKESCFLGPDAAGNELISELSRAQTLRVMDLKDIPDRWKKLNVENPPCPGQFGEEKGRETI